MSMKIQITQQDIDKGVWRNASKSKALGFLLALKLWGNSRQHLTEVMVWHFCDDGVAQFRQSRCGCEVLFEITAYIKNRCKVRLSKGFPTNSVFAQYASHGSGLLWYLNCVWLMCQVNFV